MERPAAAAAGTVRVGMSGFSYREWKGSFYPPKIRADEMLAHYATRFGAVEINTTFRQMPDEDVVARWRDQTPDGFRFTVKAYQGITHWRRLNGPEELTADFIRTVSVLGPKLGAVLFQTPPNLAFDAEREARFLASLPPSATYAFEPRHDSFGNEFRALLDRQDVALCLNDDAGDPSAYRHAGKLAYFRFRRENYSDEDLAAHARTVNAIAAQGTEVYVFFKHEDRPEAVEQALAFQELAASEAAASRPAMGS